MSEAEQKSAGDFEQVVLAALPPVSLVRFCALVGVDRATVWKWRQEGWMVTHSINNNEYVTAAEVSRFNARLQAGEFSRKRLTVPGTMQERLVVAEEGALKRRVRGMAEELGAA